MVSSARFPTRSVGRCGGNRDCHQRDPQVSERDRRHSGVGSALGGWPSSRKVSLELAGRVRCSGLPSDWKLRRITPNRHLLGLSKGYIGVATLPPPPNGFPSSLIEASARPTIETTPQQIEGFSALGKQPYALPLPVRRDGLLRQMASLHLGYDQDSPNSARCLFSSLLVVPVR